MFSECSGAYSVTYSAGRVDTNRCNYICRLHQAFDSISQEALWEVFKLYGVHPHAIKLPEDLLMPMIMRTVAFGRVDGEAGRSFTVKAYVRQGCVIEPM
eukprot:359953-Chlamydomonas_euryale.AAC.1